MEDNKPAGTAGQNKNNKQKKKKKARAALDVFFSVKSEDIVCCLDMLRRVRMLVTIV